MPKTISKVTIIKDVTIYSVYLLIVWAFYRFLFRLPDNIEELVIKPIVWLLPLAYFVVKEKSGLKSLGITLTNLFSSIYLAIGLGVIFAGEGLLTNYLKYGSLNFGANIGTLPILPSLGLSFATAFSEEISFRGYIFNRLLLIFKNELAANFVQATLWTVIHIPIAFFIWKMPPDVGIVYLFLTFMFGIGSAFLFGRTKNVFGSIFLHVLWEWPIILFR